MSARCHPGGNAAYMAGSLRGPLSLEQEHLIWVIFEPFDQTGEWALWQYVDLTLDSRFGIDTTADGSSWPAGLG